MKIEWKEINKRIDDIILKTKPLNREYTIFIPNRYFNIYLKELNKYIMDLNSDINYVYIHEDEIKYYYCGFRIIGLNIKEEILFFPNYLLPYII